MQNILLIGELNNEIESIYKVLLDEYRVQLCLSDLELVEAMMKIVKPELAVIHITEAAGFDRRIFEIFKEELYQIPVIFIGSFEECKDYINQYKDAFFRFLEKPVTQQQLCDKCEELIELMESRRSEEEAPLPSRKKKILIIDDSGVFLRNMKSLLEPKYTTILAKSGEKGVKAAMEEQPDLILLDYEMPGWNGRETLEQLRMNEAVAEIPVVFLTGVSDKEHIMDVLMMQPQGYLLKPVDSSLLNEKIHEILG